MDPNATLARMLELAAQHGRGAWHWDDTCELVELVLAMDAWIHRGGFLPSRWQEGHPGSKTAKQLEG